MDPRDYQVTCVESTLDLLINQNRKSVLNVMPTGTGKTVAFGMLTSRWPGKVLVLAHREELITQARDKMLAVMPTEDIQIEMSEQSVITDGALFGGGPRVVCASVQSLHAKRIQKFHPDYFDLIIIDECHHCVKQNKTYRHIIDYFNGGNKPCKEVGFTATPDRTDEIGLGEIFESVGIEVELFDSINDGWLVPIRQNMIHVEEIDLSRVSSHMGDLSAGQLDEILSEEGPLHKMAGPTIELVGDRKTIVFTSGVNHAHRMAEILNRHRTGCAVALDGNSDKDVRRLELKRYARGEFQFLVGCGLFLEGFDEPTIEVVVMGRPTKSRSLYCLDSETEILTDGGWVGIDGIEQIELSQIATFNMENGEIGWSPCLATVERPMLPGERFLEYDCPSLNIRVTDNHDLIVRSRFGRKRKRTEWRKIKAGSLIEQVDMVEIPIAGMEAAAGVPLTDDELRFIGWVMTDGTINRINKQITITQSVHQPQEKEIEKCIIGSGLKYKRKVVPYNSQFNATSDKAMYTVSYGKPRVTDKHLRGWSHLEPYLSKDFAVALNDVDNRQLAVLLEAIHLGDGSKQRNVPWVKKTYTITCWNKSMVERLQSLCVRRGFKCNAVTDRQGWRLHIREKSVHSIQPKASDRISPKLVTPDAVENVWCVQTDRGTIITRRKGKVAILGNSQAIGRGTRILPRVIEGVSESGEFWRLPTPEDRKAAIAASSKTHLEVIDFVGNCGIHKLVYVSDILAGKESDVVADATSEYIKATTKASGKSVDINEAILVVKKQMEQAERQKRAQIIAKANYTMRPIDPFDVFDMQVAREPGWHKGRKPTQGQLGVLERAGIPVIQRGGDYWTGDVKKPKEQRQLSFCVASKIIEEVMSRRDKQLCTYKQAALLRKYGESADVGFAEASQIINEIAANGWKPREATINAQLAATPG